MERPSDSNIVCYADAIYASLEDRSPPSGFIIFVSGMTNRMVPICWSSKNLDQVTKSLLASKTPAVSEVEDAGLSIAAMLQETFRLPRLPEVPSKTDNASLVDTLNSSNLVSNWCLRIEEWREWWQKRSKLNGWKGKNRLPDKGGSLFWKFKRLVTWMNFLKILF